MEDFILTTTPTIEGARIEKYLGIIVQNQVAGTGAISDLVASFSDVFGGNSGTYRNQLRDLYADVRKHMIEEAKGMGANAIVGLSIDYDSISAKAMSMFMVSVRGTAVKLSFPSKKAIEQSPDTITQPELDCECHKLRYRRFLKAFKPMKQECWEYMAAHETVDMAEDIIAYYIKNKGWSDDPSVISRYSITPYVLSVLSKVEFGKACDLLYDTTNFGVLFPLIKQLHLFNAEKTMGLSLVNKKELVLKLITVDKTSYSREDAKTMKGIVAYLDNLPSEGKIEEKAGGLFSKGGKRFVCACGATNAEEKTYCSVCGKDIRGLTEEENKAIDAFKDKVFCLESLLGL